MHDNVSGLLASERKEELLKLIAEQQERGEDGLEEEDRWLLEVNLDDLETTSGETQAYWLLAIKAARRAYLLRLGLLDESNSHSEDIKLKTGFLLHLTNNNKVIWATLWPDTTWGSFTPPRRRVALSRGSDCDAVWFWPSAYEDSCHG